ncbi:MAG: 4-hydroxy-3-methylbut-2-enyl diphosphate reductase, partial [Treponema sp.]|nr:4-hydroxy-3-methylbut-2-enyl diphosphate reductase [Treponema sp.]
MRARVLGFCMGVRRAVDLAEAALAQCPAAIYTLGPLIHNPQVLSSLAKKGMELLPEDPSRWPPLHNATVIIRAHGVSPAMEEELRRRGARIIDAACSRVKASQR